MFDTSINLRKLIFFRIFINLDDLLEKSSKGAKKQDNLFRPRVGRIRGIPTKSPIQK